MARRGLVSRDLSRTCSDICGTQMTASRKPFLATSWDGQQGAWHPGVLVLVICSRQAGRRNGSEEQCPEEDPGAGRSHLRPPGGPGLRTGCEEQGGEAEAGLGGGAGGTEDGAGGHAGQHGRPAGAQVRRTRRRPAARWVRTAGGKRQPHIDPESRGSSVLTAFCFN